MTQGTETVPHKTEKDAPDWRSLYEATSRNIEQMARDTGRVRMPAELRALDAGRVLPPAEGDAS